MKTFARFVKKPTKTARQPLGLGTKIFLGVLVLILVVMAFGLERKTKSNWIQNEQNWSLDAHGNLYALHRFYEQQFPSTDQKAWHTWGENEPKFQHQTNHLLFLNQSEWMTQDQFQQLLNWVSKGNHVVMALPQGPRLDTDEYEFDDEDITNFSKTQWANVEQWAGLTWTDQRKKNTQIPSLAIKNSCQNWVQDALKATQITHPEVNEDGKFGEVRQIWCGQYLNQITLPEGKSIQLLPRSERGFHIQSKNLIWQGQSQNGSHIARFKQGQGSIVLVNDMQVFGIPVDPRSMQTDLNRFDHAYLASYLAQDKQAIWFVDNIMPPKRGTTPLWKKMWQFSPWACALLLLGIVLFVWHHAYRVGSIVALNNHEQRQLQHFFHAQGEFLYRRQQRQQALHQLQQQLWLQWQKRIPNLSVLKRPEQLAAVQKIVQAHENDLALWLAPIPSTITPEQWQHYLQAHQNIRNAA